MRKPPKPTHKTGSHNTIPPKYHETIHEMVQDGKLHTDIHKWLVSEGVQCSRATVTRMIQRLTAERGTEALAIYKEAVAKTAGDDVAIINQQIQELLTLQREAYTKQDVAKYKQLASELKNWVSMRVNLLQAVDPSAVQDFEDDRSELMEKMELLEKERLAKTAAN